MTKMLLFAVIFTFLSQAFSEEPFCHKVPDYAIEIRDQLEDMELQNRPPPPAFIGHIRPEDGVRDGPLLLLSDLRKKRSTLDSPQKPTKALDQKTTDFTRRRFLSRVRRSAQALLPGAEPWHCNGTLSYRYLGKTNETVAIKA